MAALLDERLREGLTAVSGDLSGQLQKQLEQLPEAVQVAQGPQKDSLEQLRQQFESLGPAVERQICDQVAQVRAGLEAEAATTQEKLQEGVRELVESQSQESARVIAEQQDMAVLFDEHLQEGLNVVSGNMSGLLQKQVDQLPETMGAALEPLQKLLEQLPETVEAAQGPHKDSLEQLRQQVESLGPAVERAVERQICDQVVQVRAGLEADAATTQEKLQKGVRELVEGQAQESARVLAEQKDLAARIEERLQEGLTAVSGNISGLLQKQL
jgi:phage-related protein